MKNQPCVSIVVPIYNQEKYLDASIVSIMEQSYENLQIVLVNDGSTDASAAILHRYAAEDSRIVLVEKPNGGVMDATLVGIEKAHGEYICFMDPDDLLGKEYIRTFMEHMTPECDFVATGFYHEKQGEITPYALREDRFFTRDALRQHRDDFLFEKGDCGISNRFFISRWNKLYRTDIIKKAAEHLLKCKEISLGDDTLLTYLVLCYSAGGKTIAKPNGYFYNIGNPNSLTKKAQIQHHMGKAMAAYQAMKALTEEFGTSDAQAYALYGMLVDTLRQRLLDSDRKQFCTFVRQLRQDALYQKAKQVLAQAPRSGLKKLYRQMIPKDSERDLCLLPVIDLAKRCVRTLRTTKRYVAFFFDKCKKKGPVRALRLLRFQRDRDHAYDQMVQKLPQLESRILPILQPFLNRTTALEACPIEKNIFIFWWDGFDKAPDLVKRCFASVRHWNPDCRVIQVDKYNYQQYTDIHPQIVDAFSRDKISVQTFSDIMRFNLLKNNGGAWIDATIFFASEFDLFRDLEEKSFTSLAFSTTADFLQYAGIACSWSGFFIASRKNGLFVQAVDTIFRQYYLQYGTYSTYFFIDITLMLCKKYGLDADVLSKTLQTDRSMFALVKLLGAPFDTNALAFFGKIPQKLSWNLSPETGNTFYGWLLNQYND